MNFYSNFVTIVETGAEQVYALCPFHKEKVPSFTINVNTHQWYCHGCGEGGGYVSFLMKFLDVDKQKALSILKDWEDGKPLPFPAELTVSEAHTCLMNNKYALSLLHSWGVSDKLADSLSIGYSLAERRFYFPIRTQTGFLYNIRKYMPPELRGDNQSVPKVIGIAKCNDSRFWPAENLEKDTIFIVEGEKDALCAMGRGLNAVTGTGGSNIPATDYSIFRGKKVYIMTDSDDAGDKIAQKYVDVLSLHTNQLKRIKLPVKDFTDYYLKYNNADVLQYAETVKYDLDKGAKELKRQTLYENESVDNVGERVLLDNMIIVGSDPKTYAIPSVVSIKCIGSEKCKRPCKLCGGRSKLEYAFEDRDLVHMIDSTDDRMKLLASKTVNCKNIEVSTKRMVNAQRIVFQEKASLLGGLSEASSEPRYGYYLYDKERLVPTAKYIFDATKVTDPRTQKIYYVIKNAKVNDEEFKKDVDFEYYRSIAQKSTKVTEFLNYHYNKWLADCRVYGRLDLFSAFLLTMCSVTEIPYKSGTIKGVLDSMAIGDTRTGKSLLVQNMLTKLNMGGYINGENARLTGVVGGVAKLGDAWIITWGAIPLNDKGFVAIDEATGLTIEDIMQMSSVRSGCVATINKVVRGEARARTRLFWVSNPRSGKNLNEYFMKGFGAFQEFIPVNEDQARYDILVGASRDDIDTMQKIDTPVLTDMELNRYRDLINYAWHIEPSNIVVEDYDHLYDVTRQLAEKYRGGTLLIKEAAYEKVLRVAAALAILAGNVQNDKLIIDNKMLDWSSDYLEYIFNRPAIDYAYYVKRFQEEEKREKANEQYARAMCSQYPALVVLLNNTKFKGTQMSEVLGIDKDTVSKLLSDLLMKGLIKMTAGGLYSPSVSLINIVRRIEGEKHE